MSAIKSSSRRKFLKQAGAVAVAGAALPSVGRSLLAASVANRGIPPHQAIELPGVHAYAGEQSVAAGEIIRFHVSSTVPCQLSVRQLAGSFQRSLNGGPRPDDSFVEKLAHAFPESKALVQPIHPGSYAVVEKRLRQNLHAITLECWVRPWNMTRLQGIISQEDKEDSRGLALGFGKSGYVGFFLGDGVSPDEAVIHRSPEGTLKRRVWHHVVATWDGQTKCVWVDGKVVGSWPFKGVCVPGPHPIRLGAMSEKKITTRLADVDIAMPVIYERALSEAEVLQRFSEKGFKPAKGPGVLACWPLTEEKGDHLEDVSGNKRHARVINHGTWMIGGPAFDGAKVPRYEPYDPSADVTRGHGLRFASDDLYDCRWEPTHSWRVPSDAKSGIYVARIHYELNGKAQDYYVTFLVRKARKEPKADILVLCSTSTWLAYNAVPFAENLPPGVMLDTGGHKNSHPDAPAYSCYRDHAFGQPSYQFGLRVPWPAAGPYVLYSSLETGYSHLMRGERFLHSWLKGHGSWTSYSFDYDVASDLDLHRDPELLRGYKTVILNGHSEYWSADAYNGLDRYLSDGGSAIVLSGNTMFWRTTFSEDGSVMECRKFDERIGGRTAAPVGELFHSHDGRRGSLMRECGYPAWKAIGLDCCGWGSTEAKDAGVYHTEAPEHFLFQTPNPVGLAKEETFGHSPDGKANKAVGHEFDVRLSTLIGMTKEKPAGFVLPQEPAGIVTLALGKRPNPSALDFFTKACTSPDGVHAEMIYWERPQGGRVFNAGAIGAGWALAVDPKFQQLMRNALDAFGVKPKTYLL